MTNDTTISDLNIRINPLRYIHLAFENSQRVLVNSIEKGNFKDGLLANFVLIQNAEAIAKGLGILDKEYFTEIQSYEESKEMQSHKSSDLALFYGRLSTKKQELIVRNVLKKNPEMILER